MFVSILRVTRFLNLTIVAATMYLMRYCILQPLLWQKGMELQLSSNEFLMLALSTVFITAAGYVINDYFDTRTDTINRPDTVIVGRAITRRMAISMHWTFNALGVLFGVLVSFSMGQPSLSFVFILIPGILWFYSTSYKRRFLLGNILVALLTALVPLMPLLFEIPLLHTAYWQSMVISPSTFNNIFYWIGGYALFAFWLTLFREIVKDMEDVEGDKEYGCKTLPIVLGLPNSRNVAAAILMVVILLITYLFGAFLNYLPNGRFNLFTLLYLSIGLIIPMFYMIIRLLTAQEKKHFSRVSTVAKIVMLVGILYTIPFAILI